MDAMTDTAKLEEILARLRSLDAGLAMLVDAWDAGGARGFRQALRRVAQHG